MLRTYPRLRDEQRTYFHCFHLTKSTKSELHNPPATSSQTKCTHRESTGIIIIIIIIIIIMIIIIIIINQSLFKYRNNE